MSLTHAKEIRGRGRGRSLRYDLTGMPPGPGVVAACREATRRALSAWFGPADAPDTRAVADALLLVSEVVTNAHTYGGVPSELRLDGTDRALWVQVSDTNPDRPRPHGPHRAYRSSGHGLYLLQRLAARWGTVPRGQDGKTVWFQVDLFPEASGPGGS
ncbi:ATP-binding protein [Streptomyces sp. SKN60]|uniref:ATP-binding protein n=1 Tax=Streptomyces sp. SKN60 TaxID=2855506 RepID=UPI0022477083|nr:ATP-binding protein [Streptomyces sp. SKN60]